MSSPHQWLRRLGVKRIKAARVSHPPQSRLYASQLPRSLGIGTLHSPLGALLDEEPLEQGAAFVFTHPGGNRAMVIQGRKLQNIQDAAGSAGFRVAAAEDNPPEAHMDHGA